jgi:hypothetical protein
MNCLIDQAFAKLARTSHTMIETDFGRAQEDGLFGACWPSLIEYLSSDCADGQEDEEEDQYITLFLVIWLCTSARADSEALLQGLSAERIAFLIELLHDEHGLVCANARSIPEPRVAAQMAVTFCANALKLEVLQPDAGTGTVYQKMADILDWSVLLLLQGPGAASEVLIAADVMATMVDRVPALACHAVCKRILSLLYAPSSLYGLDSDSDLIRMLQFTGTMFRAMAIMLHEDEYVPVAKELEAESFQIVCTSAIWQGLRGLHHRKRISTALRQLPCSTCLYLLIVPALEEPVMSVVMPSVCHTISVAKEFAAGYTVVRAGKNMFKSASGKELDEDMIQAMANDMRDVYLQLLQHARCRGANAPVLAIEPLLSRIFDQVKTICM